MYKLLKSKKGIAIDDLIPLLFTFFIIIIAIIFASIAHTSKEKSTTQDISEIQEKIEATDNLINFLQMPIENFDTNFQKTDKAIDFDDITISSLIVLSYIDNDYSLLDNLSKGFFEEIYESKELTSYVITLVKKPGNVIIREIDGSSPGISHRPTRNKITKVYIPLNKEEKIEINLFRKTSSY